VDDQSEDSTIDVIKEYLIKDKRFKLYVRPNNKKKGANSCRNYGLEKATGEFIHWFDSDDIAHPDYINISLNLIKEYKVDFCRFSRSVFRGEFHYNFEIEQAIPDVMFVNSDHIEKMLKNELIFNTCNVIWRKSSLEEEKFNEDIVYADEWEYYSRLLSNGLIGVSIENELFFGRKHNLSTTFEFYNNDPIRRASKIKAVKLVIENLSKKGLLSHNLVHYFLRTGFFLKEFSVIEYVLNRSNAGTLKRLKYIWGFRIYPVLKPIFYMKAKLKKS
jgi:glycosyltransferase involved in cell wall biosynthesis